MFRTHLAIVLLVLFLFVLFSGIALYWLSSQVSRNDRNSQKSFEAFDQYQELSQEAHHYFKQRMERLYRIDAQADSDSEPSNAELEEAMRKLRDVVLATPVPQSRDDLGTGKSGELERVAQFTAFLDACEYRFTEIERLQEQNQPEMATQMLAKFSKEEIDGKFRSMIAEAIESERAKIKKGRKELAHLVARFRWSAILLCLGAAIFSLACGWFFPGGLQKRMAALLQGTDEVASGHLDYRIGIDTHDEFAELADHFNQMARELELSQNKLREGRIVLEQRVADRTRELNRLNEELRRMDSARRDFLADISHELRTPITVIRGEAEVTLRGRDRPAEEYKEALQRVLELSMQLGKYVKDLLFLAQTETAGLQFEWEDLDFAELVRGSEENFQVMAEENAMSVSLDGPAEPVWVRGDRQRLKQILFILVDNACRYSKPKGHIAVILRVSETEARCSIEDQGIGIPAKDLDRIFERQFRSPNARRSREDGRGLGLAMAKSILKAHDGQITVTSIENSGSTFTVILPLLSGRREEFSA